MNFGADGVFWGGDGRKMKEEGGDGVVDIFEEGAFFGMVGVFGGNDGRKMNEDGGDRVMELHSGEC